MADDASEDQIQKDGGSDSSVPPSIVLDRWQNRRKMAWVSVVSMVAITLLTMFVVPIDRLDKIKDVVTWFYFAMTSVVGSYIGFTTYAYLKKPGE